MIIIATTMRKLKFVAVLFLKETKLKNDYLKPSDITGKQNYMNANGDITEGTIINLRIVNFGGLELTNIKASVVKNQSAPIVRSVRFKSSW